MANTFLMTLMAFGANSASAADLRIGMIGLDTSHVTAFTKLINDASDPQHVPGGKVVAAFKGGSPDIEPSASRVDGYTKELQEKYGVKIYDSIAEMCKNVDAVMLESVDGRPHLEQVKPVFAAGKPVFIDKPVAGSLHDAIEIFRLATAAKVPCFTASSYRYYKSLQDVMKQDYGDVRSCISIGPCHLEPHHPDLFWYGVHATEALFTVMGAGCETVVRTTTPDTDVVTGTWKDGRVGVLYGIRTSGTPHKVVIFGSKSVAEQENSGDYAPLVVEVMKFFQTGKAPVAAEETINMFAFMEAADQSKRTGGAPVKISDVMVAVPPVETPERNAIGNLQTILGAERAHCILNKGVYGSFEMLKKGYPPCIEGNFEGVMNGYRYTLTVGADGKSFKTLAIPDTPNTNNNRRFYTDQSGVIRVTTDGSEPNQGSTPIGQDKDGTFIPL